MKNDCCPSVMFLPFGRSIGCRVGFWYVYVCAQSAAALFEHTLTYSTYVGCREPGLINTFVPIHTQHNPSGREMRYLRGRSPVGLELTFTARGPRKRYAIMISSGHNRNRSIYPSDRHTKRLWRTVKIGLISGERAPIPKNVICHAMQDSRDLRAVTNYGHATFVTSLAVCVCVV